MEFRCLCKLPKPAALPRRVASWVFHPRRLAKPSPGTANTIEPLAYAAIQGRGIAFLPTFLVRDALEDGRLVTVLDEDMDRQSLWLA